MKLTINLIFLLIDHCNTCRKIHAQYWTLTFISSKSDITSSFWPMHTLYACSIGNIQVNCYWNCGICFYCVEQNSIFNPFNTEHPNIMLSCILMLCIKQEHEVCKGRNELIMVSTSVSTSVILHDYESLAFQKLNFH
jgi:uncharacterized membrane protein